MPTHLFIISRKHGDLYHDLQERFAEDPGVQVICDRRVGERRMKASPAAAERRRADRRSHPEIDEQLQVRSLAVVAVAPETTPLRDVLQWTEAIHGHVAVIRGVLTEHERLRAEVGDAARELGHISAQLGRVLANATDLLARMRGGSGSGPAE